MTHFFQSLQFQFSPEGKLFLLPGDIILPENVPEGRPADDFCRNALGIMPGINAAQALNADNHTVQAVFPLCGIHHSQGVGIFRTPDMHHVRLKLLQLLPEHGFCFRQILVRKLGCKGCVTTLPIHNAASQTGIRAEDPDGQVILPAKILQDMVCPETVSIFAGHGFFDRTGYHIAQPKQFHGRISFLLLFKHVKNPFCLNHIVSAFQHKGSCLLTLLEQFFIGMFQNGL